MQMTPVIARQAAHLTVFHRTANYSVPASNAPVSDEEDRLVKADYCARREQAANSPSGLGFIPGKTSALDATLEERACNRLGFGFALCYYGILLDQKANDAASEFVCRKIGQQVADPVLREKLTPKGHGFGTRRPSVGSGYFETFNRGNVELADLLEAPIVEFTPESIRTTAQRHAFDVVVFATGFDAFTGSLLAPEIVGRGGLTLQRKWADGPVTQLGVSVQGFPNLLIVVGPGSPSLSNVPVSTEEQLDWLAELLKKMDADHEVEFEAMLEAEQAWVAHVNKRATETLYMTAASYYNGAEILGKPRVFMPYSGGVRGYRRILQRCTHEGYSGFALRKRPATPAGNEERTR